MNRRWDDPVTSVAAAFDEGASSYDTYASMQKRAAAMLVKRIDAFVGETPVRRVVDLGCGTGMLTRMLAERLPHAAFVACDLAPAMLEQTYKTLALSKGGTESERFSLVRADAEFATFAPTPDLVASNLAMQWFGDPLGALSHHARRSRFVAWTTLVEGTFAAWIEAHEKRNMSHGLRNFLDTASIVAACERLRPLRLQCHVDYLEEDFPNAVEFLRSLRLLGAATARPGHQPIPLQRILRNFTKGFTAEYRICTILLEMQK